MSSGWTPELWAAHEAVRLRAKAKAELRILEQTGEVVDLDERPPKSEMSCNSKLDCWKHGGVGSQDCDLWGCEREDADEFGDDGEDDEWDD